MTEDIKEECKLRAHALFRTPQDLDEAIGKYIDNPPKRKCTVGDSEVEIPCITIAGLCYELGFESRQSFYDYEKRKGFSYIVKRARLYIESEYEAKLHQSNCTGAIFALKQMGWADKQHIDQNILNGGVMVVPAITSVEQWSEAAKESQKSLKQDARK